MACGFVRQASAPALLSKSEQGEECLVLTEENESTSHLVKARRLLMQTAIQDLQMSAEDLPRYKPPPPAISLSSSQNASSSGFNPYQRHRYNAAGQPQQPDSYESKTETRLRQLQSRQERLEKQLQGEGPTDRELVALRPNPQTSPIASVANPTASSDGPSDGALLAQRMQRLEQERKEREEGGFTTKAMRDLAKMKQAKVYAYAKLRIQFPDGTALEAKFLPRETVDTVKQVVMESFCVSGLDFDLYVAPPRRKLGVSQTLQEEGLVPAAKCFVSWKGGGPSNDVVFIKSELFQSDAAAPSFPAAKPVVEEAKRKATGKISDGADASKGKPSKEEALLARMMGGSSATGSKAKKASGDSKMGKPKWFKG